jgi:hypothetical protein
MRNVSLLTLFALLFYSCKKEAVKQMLPPSVIAINPSSGRPNSDVTITGTNFSTVLSGNIVKFNGFAAAVTSATSSTLVAKVPIGAGTGPVIVTTSLGTSAGPVYSYIPDVYVGGTEFKGSILIGKYWKNGVVTPATDSSQSAFIYSMALSDTNVYLAGHQTNSSGVSIAKYWRNGVATTLSNGSHNAYSYCIKVVNGDVYVAGTASNGTKNVATYWKNGVATALTDGTNDGTAWSIVVVGSDVYVSGDETAPNGISIAKYWKNGIPTTLTNLPNIFTSGSQIAVDGSDVHVAIYEFDGAHVTYKYWKNGVTTDIPGATQIDQLSIISNDVYMAGSQSRIASYWKDGVAVALTDGSNVAFAHSIALYGSDVYVAGGEYNGAFEVGKYWKNGIPTNFTSGPFDASGWSIIVR